MGFGRANEYTVRIKEPFYFLHILDTLNMIKSKELYFELKGYLIIFGVLSSFIFLFINKFSLK